MEANTDSDSKAQPMNTSPSDGDGKSQQTDREDIAALAAPKCLKRLCELARLPGEAMVLVANSEFSSYSSESPQADLNIFPLPDKLDPDFLWSLRDSTHSSCLFTRECVLA